ncbi:hypothetical protein LguiA_002821 [Lonicera macranthoides]
MPRSLLIFKDMAYTLAINITETLKQSGVIINPSGLGLGKANDVNRSEEEEIGAINLTETLKQIEVIINPSGLGLGKANEVNRSEEEEIGDGSSNSSIIHKSRNRISLTCRVVIKVHKNLFKF